MQKKLIALAVASILAAPLAAQAGVEVYGQARMSLDFSSNNDPVATNEESALAVSSNKSRFGFRGDEDLGGGLKALWLFEQGVNYDTAAWGTVNRDAYVGLGGGLGTVLAGRINTPYKMSTQGMDIFVNTRGDYNAIMGMANTEVGLTGTTHFNNRFSNSIQYLSPVMGGFKGAVAYSVAGDDLRMSTTTSKKDAFSMSGSYAQGPLSLIAAYESINSAVNDATAFKIGGTFTLGGMTTLGAIWEAADLGGTNEDRDAIYLNVAHKMNAITLKAAFTKAGDTGNLVNTGATQFALGAAYALSKTTEAYPCNP